jgi:hypothetical protein
MTIEINEDFIGTHSDSGGIWTFIIPGEIAYISESIDRFATVAHDLFAACEGFIRPIELEYPVQTYSKDGPIESIHPMNETTDVEILSVERKTIADESGLTADDIPFKSHNQQGEGVNYIGEMESVHTESFFTVKDYDGWIDRTNTQYVKPARLDKIYDGQATHDPIGIRLGHRAIPARTADTNSTFGISIESSTDVWFEETPVGRANRHRLEAFFERLFERFNVVDTMVTGRGPNERLRAFFPK